MNEKMTPPTKWPYRSVESISAKKILYTPTCLRESTQLLQYKGSSPKYRLNSHIDWLKKKPVIHCDWLIGKSSTENRLPRENYKGDSRVANQNPAVPIINQSESDSKRYLGDDKEFVLTFLFERSCIFWLQHLVWMWNTYKVIIKWTTHHFTHMPTNKRGGGLLETQNVSWRIKLSGFKAYKIHA